MKSILFTTLFVIIMANNVLLAQKKDTIYYNATWEETTKKNAVFYRPMPLLVVNELKLIRDYYRNGNLQMQGYVMRNDEKKYVGMAFWYNEDGSDNDNVQYSMPFSNSKLTFYYPNGKVLMTTEYKNSQRNGENIVFNPNGSVLYQGTYIDGFSVNGTFNAVQNWRVYTHNTNHEGELIEDAAMAVPIFPSAYKGKTVVEKLFWYNANNLNNKILAEENVIYFEENVKTYISRKNYSKEGKLLQNLGKQDFNHNNQIKSGIEYQYKTFLGFAIADISNKVQVQETRVVNLENVHSLIVNEYNINFYQKKATIFTEIDYKVSAENDNSEGNSETSPEDRKPSFIVRYKEGEEKGELDLKNYVSDDERIINADEIMAFSPQDLTNDIAKKEWTSEIKEKGQEFKEKKIIKMLNNQVIMVQTFYFRDALNYENTEEAKQKKWRLSDARFYNYFVINLGKNKHIVALFNRDNLETVLIPLKNGYFINNKKKFVESQNNKDWTKNTKEIQEVLGRFEAKNFYTISKNTQRKSIDDVFGTDVLDGKYDSVRFNKSFFITEMNNKNKEITVYNTLLEKLPLKNLKAAYFSGDDLLILQNNEVKYIDIKGQTPQKNTRNFAVCGTVSHYHYRLDSISPKRNVNQLVYYVNGPGARYDYNRTLIFNNLTKDFEVTFLDKSKYFEYDDNSSMFGEKNINPNQLLVSKKTAGKPKYGIYTYGEENLRSELILDERDENKSSEEIEKMEKYKKFFNKVITITAKEELPIVYDAISTKNGIIILQKDNKFGVFPFQKEPKYKSVGEIKGAFMRFEMPNGQKGWLDLGTQTDFLDN